MLVLSRQAGEEIRICDDIVVRVLEIRGNKVRLGITANADVPIYREEVHQRIQAGQRVVDPNNLEPLYQEAVR